MLLFLFCKPPRPSGTVEVTLALLSTLATKGSMCAWGYVDSLERSLWSLATMCVKGGYLNSGYKSMSIENGLSKSFRMACFVSFSLRIAFSVGIFQSMPRLSSIMLMPPSA